MRDDVFCYKQISVPNDTAVDRYPLRLEFATVKEALVCKYSSSDDIEEEVKLSQREDLFNCKRCEVFPIKAAQFVNDVFSFIVTFTI